MKNQDFPDSLIYAKISLAKISTIKVYGINFQVDSNWESAYFLPQNLTNFQIIIFSQQAGKQHHFSFHIIAKQVHKTTL